MRIPCFKVYFLLITSHWRTFYKHDIQGVFLKCVEILSTRLFDNVED
jgi:hypothetical protein